MMTSPGSAFSIRENAETAARAPHRSVRMAPLKRTDVASFDLSRACRLERAVAPTRIAPRPSVARRERARGWARPAPETLVALTTNVLRRHALRATAPGHVPSKRIAPRINGATPPLVSVRALPDFSG